MNVFYNHLETTILEPGWTKPCNLNFCFKSNLEKRFENLLQRNDPTKNQKA